MAVPPHGVVGYGIVARILEADAVVATYGSVVTDIAVATFSKIYSCLIFPGGSGNGKPD